MAEGEHALLARVEAGFALIGVDARRRLMARWLSDGGVASGRGLRISLMGNAPPLAFRDQEGQPAGLLVDLWREWGRRVGHDVWFQLRNTLVPLESVEADIIGDLPACSDYSGRFLVSSQVHAVALGIYHRRGEPGPASLGELEGAHVGAMAGNCAHAYISSRMPEVDLHVYNDRFSMLNALMDGRLDAVAASRATMGGTLIQSRFAAQLVASNYHYDGQYVAGVRPGREDLLRLLNVGLTELDEAYATELDAQWIPDEEGRYYRGIGGEVRLTAEERSWIEENNPVRIAVHSSFHPLEYTDERGGIQGVSADLLALVSQRTGLLFAPLTTEGTPQESVQFGEAPLLGLNLLPEDELSGLTRIGVLEDMPLLLYGPAKSRDAFDLSRDRGLRVALPAGYPADVAGRLGSMGLVAVESAGLRDSMQRVAAGGADLLLASSPLQGDWLIDEGWVPVRPPLPLSAHQAAGYAVREDQTRLLR
ncbi:MAG: hypothetical protein B0D89_06960 [Candidatus Sedimenticola endophacoides]|nr:MAG: hypothetical protein B0D94_00525 [Candidatus Sedimenticola endophacoides]OQX40652.1 MAG: hypothetical protein B0D89_06960 [Candidatus Sedimenticola endophacoides]